ncbi:type II toxin-antitoxin system ParD family antitoxin [Sphingomonas sp. LT1P40]|uniref:type II toxin-antitoxin system ParD family antitoxin n=1 Tax=Alteristakelama amylovorans TaxID=3096166 RepID=UPI002FCB1CE5
MAQMNVSLPDGLKAWAESRVAESRYSSTSDYVRDLIRRDQENEKWRALHAAIEEGLANPETNTTVQDIISEFRAR